MANEFDFQKVMAQTDNVLGTDADERRRIENGRKGTNAELPFYWPKPVNKGEPPYFISRDHPDDGSGAATHTDGTVVTYPDVPQNQTNTLAHESFHQRHDYGIHASPAETRVLRKHMKELQPEGTYDPQGYALNAYDNPEETFASLFGSEAVLPKGTALSQTPEGKHLFRRDITSPLTSPQDLKDAYMSTTSRGVGGVWEGQSQEPTLDMLQRKLKEWKRSAFDSIESTPFLGTLGGK